MEHPVPVRGRGVHGASSTGSEVGGYMEHPVPVRGRGYMEHPVPGQR